MSYYGNNEDAGDLSMSGAASYAESVAEDQAGDKAATYADWIATRATWAKDGHSSDDKCEGGCDKVLTAENIAVTDDGWMCDPCHANYVEIDCAYEPQEDFGADNNGPIGDWWYGD